MVSRLKDNVDDHRQYDEALDSAGRWLATMSERVAACSDTSGDWHVIQDRIEEIKVRPILRDDEDGDYVGDDDDTATPSAFRTHADTTLFSAVKIGKDLVKIMYRL